MPQGGPRGPAFDPVPLRRRVDEVLAEFADRESALLEAVDPELAPVAEVLRDTAATGKRLRAAFCYWGWRGAFRGDGDDIVRASAALELVHAAACVHDDLIDRSAVRHGRATAHRSLGDARPDTGPALALLVGDLLISWSGQLFTDCGLPAAYLNRARPLWAALARELVAGECLEVLRTRRGTAVPDPADSLKVIRYKTAKYTVEHPLHIGGLLAGAPPALLEAYSAYGIPLGEAFQLRDDLLGVFGSPEATGKSNLDDLTGAKPTVLLALTMAAATDAERLELRALLDHPSPGGGELLRYRELAEATGAREGVEELIVERAARAARAVETARAARLLAPDAADALHTLAARSLSRTA
ncbi:polyprenyl synthetase family protein [Streptomyces sp. NPDC059070]|uniref:polyprenyl synthetase family protein n=1 Tax=unclassified Streptomyces TaxID=2593676 RepID=UPI0034E27E57